MAISAKNENYTVPLQNIRKVQPIHKQLYQILRKPIVSGDCSPGSKLPTELELARMYDISRITVRRALQELKAEGLTESQKGRGTFVLNRAKIIAKHRYLFIHDNTSPKNYPYTQMLLRGIQGMSQNLGFRLEMLATSLAQERSAKDIMAAELIESADFHGVMALSGYLTQKEVQNLKKQDIPIVFISHAYDDTIELGSKVVRVECDTKSVLPKLFEHLLKRGHKKIGYIGKPPLEFESHRELICNICAEEGMEFKASHYEPSDYGIKPGAQACCRLLKRHPEIQAVISHDDLRAVGSLQYLHSIGKKIPQEVAVAGIGNFLGTQSHFDITTIDSRAIEQGCLAIKCLEDIVSGKNVEKNIWIEPILIIRKTT